MTSTPHFILRSIHIIVLIIRWIRAAPVVWIERGSHRQSICERVIHNIIPTYQHHGIIAVSARYWFTITNKVDLFITESDLEKCGILEKIRNSLHHACLFAMFGANDNIWWPVTNNSPKYVIGLNTDLSCIIFLTSCCPRFYLWPTRNAFSHSFKKKLTQTLSRKWLQKA